MDEQAPHDSTVNVVIDPSITIDNPQEIRNNIAKESKVHILLPARESRVFASYRHKLSLRPSFPSSNPISPSEQFLRPDFVMGFVIPVVILGIKIYGQWFTTEKRFLLMVANPTSQLSVIGNLVGTWAVVRIGWKESAVSVFTLGLADYLVVFVTLYQILSGANHFPAMLRPDLFLFVAAPSMASLGWSSISGSFGLPCKMLFFLSLFLFTSLICLPTLFKKSMKRFNVAWWAYSFPLTFLALASAEYAQQVKGFVASTLMLILSVLVFLGIMVFTAANTDRLLQENGPCLSLAGTTVQVVNLKKCLRCTVNFES